MTPRGSSSSEDEGAEKDGVGEEAVEDRQDAAAELFAPLGPVTAAPVHRPPRGRPSSGAVGIALLVVLAVLCAALIVAVVVKTRNDAATAAREAAAYTPPPLSSSEAAAAAVGSIAVIGDESAQRAASGVGAATRWPRLLARELDADLDLQTGTGAGYASVGSAGRTFVAAARRVPADADVVLIVGGASDEATASLALARAATEAFSAATQRAPDATVIAVGPLYRPTDVSEADFDALRTTLRSAARIAGIRWVDPVTGSWLSSVGATGELGAADERAIAQRMQALLADDE